MDYLFHIVPAVAVGLQITLKIFIITIILSLPLGILMAIGRISKIAILRKAGLKRAMVSSNSLRKASMPIRVIKTGWKPNACK